MHSCSSIGIQTNSELTCLYEIIRLSQPQTSLQDFFQKVMGILSERFPVGYSALILHDSKRDSLLVEGLYGIGRDFHTLRCNSRKGVIIKAIQSRNPMVILNLDQEPLYEGGQEGAKQTERIRPPLLCIPLIIEEETLGVININSLYGSQNEFFEDFQFLTILSAVLAPVIKSYQQESHYRYSKLKTKSLLLEEILEQRLTEVLEKIDPYVEAKTEMCLLNDVVTLVEKTLIKSALEKVGHVQTGAAQLLGINRNTLRKKIKDLKIKNS